jgi:flagellar biosynthesis/type III secretory pathway ATPase
MLILEYGPTKTLTGHIYLQNALNSHIPAIRVGTRRSISTVMPEIIGVATRVVEKVARSIKTIRRGQSFVNQTGHLLKSPKNLLLYPLVSTVRGEKNDLR